MRFQLLAVAARPPHGIVPRDLGQCLRLPEAVLAKIGTVNLGYTKLLEQEAEIAFMTTHVQSLYMAHSVTKMGLSGSGDHFTTSHMDVVMRRRHLGMGPQAIAEVYVVEPGPHRIDAGLELGMVRLG